MQILHGSYHASTLPSLQQQLSPWVRVLACGQDIVRTRPLDLLTEIPAPSWLVEVVHYMAENSPELFGAASDLISADRKKQDSVSENVGPHLRPILDIQKICTEERSAVPELVSDAIQKVEQDLSRSPTYTSSSECREFLESRTEGIPAATLAGMNHCRCKCPLSRPDTDIYRTEDEQYMILQAMAKNKDDCSAVLLCFFAYLETPILRLFAVDDRGMIHPNGNLRPPWKWSRL